MRTIVALIVISSLCWAASEGWAQSPAAVRCLPSTVRLRPTDTTQGDATATISAAKNETESFQVAVFAEGTSAHECPVAIDP